MKDNYYLKALFALLLFVVFVAIVSGVYKWGVGVAKEEIVDTINSPPITCGIKYRDIEYKGFCNKEVLDNFKDLVALDRRLELIKMCIPNVYACERFNNIQWRS